MVKKRAKNKAPATFFRAVWRAPGVFQLQVKSKGEKIKSKH
jgi:hypothetical protein